MTRAALLSLALLAAACERQSSPASRIGLRLPLPEGWRATATSSGLAAGPPGRAVLLLEDTTRPLPVPEAFFASVEAEDVVVLDKESVDDFIGVTYTLSARRAFLGVHRAGPRTIWCSTTADAKSADVTAAAQVCRDISRAAEADK